MTSPASVAEALLDDGVKRRIFPAGAAEAGSSAGPLWRHATGRLTFDADAAETTAATIFDLASLTKPIATTSVALKLEADGLLDFDTRLAAAFADWTGADRSGVTVRHLLEHTSGLSPRLLDRPPLDRRAFEREICTMPLEYVPGTKALYSDLGFILLQFCCEQRGQAILAFQTDALLQPLLGEHQDAQLLTSLHTEQRRRTAPTDPLPEDERRGRRLVGEVHDNYAAALGGFAGHAGLFGTASGVGIFAAVVLRAARGMDAAPRPFTPSIVRRAVSRTRVPGSSRAMGWDTMLPTSSCGTRMSSAAFGHVGFTGTSLWIDPERDRYFVLLTNRVCDGGTSEDMQQVRRSFHDALGDF